jgi:hypothetical protein
VTRPAKFETTPLDGPGLQWLEMYAKARATMKTEVVDYGNATPTPWMDRLYDGWQLVEPEPEPQPQMQPKRTFLQRIRGVLR